MPLPHTHPSIVISLLPSGKKKKKKEAVIQLKQTNTIKYYIFKKISQYLCRHLQMSFNEWSFFRAASLWGCSHDWETPHSTTGCSSRWNLCTTQTWEGPRWKRGGQGCPVKHWGKTLMLTITGPRGQGQRKVARAKNGPGNVKSSRELHPYSWVEWAVSKVDLLGMWRVLLHGAVRAFQPEEEEIRYRMLESYTLYVTFSKANYFVLI